MVRQKQRITSFGYWRKYIFQRRAGGGWVVILHDPYVRLGHVSHGETAPWIAYGRDGIVRGGAKTRDEAAHILEQSYTSEQGA